jgi:hypothetical protein
MVTNAWPGEQKEPEPRVWLRCSLIPTRRKKLLVVYGNGNERKHQLVRVGRRNVESIKRLLESDGVLSSEVTDNLEHFRVNLAIAMMEFDAKQGGTKND